MKTFFFAVMFLVTASAIYAHKPPEVNEKVLKLFNETFKNPEQVSWKELDDSYEVYFKQGDITNRVQYDKDGNIIQYLRNYSEDQLPFHILSCLKKKYTDRSIFGVTEFFSGTDLSYFVTMQDDKHWYTVKSDNIGNLEQTEKLNKSDNK
jgi:hypothetical protein